MSGLTKFDRKELDMLRVILKHGRLIDAVTRIEAWVKRAGDNAQLAEARQQAANELLDEFAPYDRKGSK